MGKLVFIIFISLPHTALAFVSGPKLHPMDMMHALPRGEEPGWNGTIAAEVEINVANVWNRPLTMQRKSNGEFLTYVADYEQVGELISASYAPIEDISIGFETWYVSRGGGFLDHTIEDAHTLFHMGNFERTAFPRYRSDFGTSTSRDENHHGSQSGFTNYVFKSKWWFHRFRSRDAYDGLAIGIRYKLPADDGASGLSSGDRDVSYTFNAGVPLIEKSTVNVSFAYSKLGDNRYFKNFPRKMEIWMYDLSLRVDIGSNWLLIGSISSQSPLLDVSQLDYIPHTGPNAGSIRADPGWKGLTEWRTQETFGAQKLFESGNALTIYFTEDWDIGDRDIIGDWLSINGAPDISVGANYKHALPSF